jgi:hypothetical protein
MSYDLWKTSAPEREFRPMKCSGCGDRVDDIEDHDENDIHCYDEDSGEPVGYLKWDWAWTWRDDDPDIP